MQILQIKISRNKSLEKYRQKKYEKWHFFIENLQIFSIFFRRKFIEKI